MSPMPSHIEDHWAAEPGADPDRAQLMWFMCLGRDPVVGDIVKLGQERLAGLDELDLVPSEWLHMTILIAGYADEIPASQVSAMTMHARKLLAPMQPIRIDLSRVLYHARAIMLSASPQEALAPVLTACQEATRSATGRAGRLHRQPWVPHITMAYGNSSSPAAPAIRALGKNLPARQTTITSASLISQTPAQKFRWHLIADAPIGQ
jgi:2'-5' RNA ligase